MARFVNPYPPLDAAAREPAVRCKEVAMSLHKAIPLNPRMIVVAASLAGLFSGLATGVTQ